MTDIEVYGIYGAYIFAISYAKEAADWLFFNVNGWILRRLEANHGD